MSRSGKFKRIAALAAAVSMVMAAGSCGESNQPEQTSDSTESAVETAAPEESTTEAKTSKVPLVTTTTTTTPAPLPVMSDEVPAENTDFASVGSPKTFEEYYNINKDMVGWINIYIPNENDINEPVVQGEDNTYYLTHDFLGTEVKEGAIFADFKCAFTTRTRPANTILYGHNMASGKSFAKLTRYCTWNTSKITGQRLGISQYIAAPTITFDTVWEKGTYKVFAAIFVNTEEKNGEVFKYYKQRTISGEGEFYDYIGKIMDRSLFFTDVDLEYGDELLTLSTCYYPLTKQAADTRFVVFARRVRDGESAEVDTSKAVENPNPLYFDYYYQVNGGSWKGRNWDTDPNSTDTTKTHLKIKGFDEYYKSHETTASTEG